MTRQPPPGMNETIAAEVEGRTPAPVSHVEGRMLSERPENAQQLQSQSDLPTLTSSGSLDGEALDSQWAGTIPGADPDSVGAGDHQNEHDGDDKLEKTNFGNTSANAPVSHEEPVAWRFRWVYPSNGEPTAWAETHNPIVARQKEADGWDVRPLYEHPPSPEPHVRGDKRLVRVARAFLRHFNPTDLSEDASQQWQALEHLCNLAEMPPEPQVIGWHAMNDSGWSDITDRQDIADQWIADGFIVTPLVAALAAEGPQQ